MIEGFRRNDYIASIRSDIAEIDINISATERVIQDIIDLTETCKENKERKFVKVLKLDIKNEKLYIKDLQRRKKRLSKLLYIAEKYTPGRGA